MLLIFAVHSAHGNRRYDLRVSNYTGHYTSAKGGTVFEFYAATAVNIEQGRVNASEVDEIAMVRKKETRNKIPNESKSYIRT